MQMKTAKNYFEYTIPFNDELSNMYISPYRFSKELRDSAQYMFSHPVYNAKYHKLFYNLCKEFDTNDMLKRPYRQLRYYIDYPQRFGHNVENVIPHMLVSMWKTFIRLHKNLRGVEFNDYMKTNMQMVELAKGNFIDIFLSDIKNMNIIYESDDMIKPREGIGLREKRKATQEGSKYFEYLCKLV